MISKDVDLLALELDTLWDTDERGRLCGVVHPWPHLAIAVGIDGRALAIGSDVPDALADDLRQAALSHPPATETGPADPPSGLDDCVRLLAALGRVTVTSGPSFVVPAGIESVLEPAPRRSDPPDLDLIPLRPVDWWEPAEWVDLLAGTLGPWAMTVESGRVTALCHTSRSSDHAVEAGVWTHPDFRGQGRAAAVTSAWAGHAALGDRIRFYSTSAENLASRGVAAKLGLRPIGWIWQVAVARDVLGPVSS